MADDANLRLFLVEHNLRGLPPASRPALTRHWPKRSAGNRRAASGSATCSASSAADGRCLCLFAAENPVAVLASP